MKIAIMGTGRVGGTLGRRWAQGGHQIIFGSRGPDADKVQALLSEAGSNASAAGLAEAAAAADTIVLATPWFCAHPVIESLGDIAGKILVDCTNPLNSDFSGLDLGHTTSAAEHIAEWAAGARVVKAFNNVSSVAMADPVFNGQKATMFYCGDDADAKAVVGQLAGELGFDAVDAGPLTIARYLEPLAMLYIQLAVSEGWGSNYAFKVMKR